MFGGSGAVFVRATGYVRVYARAIARAYTAFEGCRQLADADGFVIFNHVLYSYCSDDTMAVIPNSVTKIVNQAFRERHQLTKVIVPDSVKTIDPQAFFSCEKLTEIVLPDGLKHLDTDTLRSQGVWPK